MKIPIFVSAPTALSKAQDVSRKLIIDELDKYGLEARALGRSDYPTESPLREILVIARHCAGGVILGFEQLRTESGTRKVATGAKSKGVVSLPTPWNQLEAGILFSLGLPLLIFKEANISGGIFDHGVSDVFVQPMPSDMKTAERESLSAVFLKWQAEVRRFYYK